MIDTLVTYVRSQTSVNVLRIAATATTIGISTAGSVSNTNSKITSAPRPPISPSTSTLALPLEPCSDASSSGSCPVTCTLIPAGSPAAAAARIAAVPLLVLNVGEPGG